MLCTLFSLLLTGTQATNAITVDHVLALDRVGSGGRVPISTNAVTSMIVNGTFTPPKEGDKVTDPDGKEHTWETVKAGEDGSFSGSQFRGGFAYASVPSTETKVMMMEASGDSYAYVNGEPRGGDPYSFGYVRTPVLLKRGDNSFLFSVGRGRLSFRLVPPDSPLMIEKRDATLPDLIVGEEGIQLGAAIVTNASDQVWSGVSLSVTLEGSKSVIVPIGDMPPLSSQKVAFSFLSPKFNEPGTKKLFLRLNQQNERTPMDVSQEFDISVKNLWDLHKRTFISRVDNSVQYYAVRPPFKNDVSSADALILSVHGAGVEATGQAAAYGAKSWAWIVAATNRRPFGFDWEDWGTIDAMEVLADAKARYKPREDRIYLTGHSMGGHGAWYLGATFPDQWGAVAPCAGWINFWQYGGGVKYDNPDPIESLLLRVANPSDPLKIIHNYADFGVYTVNGQSDDTVPIEQARTMRKLLSEFHHDVDFFEQPGAGHWYDVDPAPGADSVDYAPMMEFLDRHRRRLPKEARRVEFWTTCPQVSAKSHWVTVLQQEQQFAPSSVVAINPTGTQTFEVTTTNIAALKIDVADSPVPDAAANVTIKLDGTEIDAAQSPDGSLTFMKSATGWVLSNALDAREKNPERGGPFKHAFDNGFVLVYGTTGTPEENAWSYAKARYDAESWWYRGNGRAQIVPDTSVQQGPSLNSKNYILYGSEDTNSAIKFFCEKSPVHVTRESIKVGDREIKGADLSIMMVYPGPDSLFDKSKKRNQFAIVGGTGIVGMRDTNTMPYFVSGVHYPDLMVYDSRLPMIGSKAVRVAGLFGNDWSVENGEFDWRD